MSFYTLNNYQPIQITGNNAQKFLQGQLTIDVNKLSPNTAQLAAHCNPKGRIIANFIICCIDEFHYTLLTPGDVAAKLQQTLQKYVMFSKVAVELSGPQPIIATEASISHASLTMAMKCPPINLHWMDEPFDTEGCWQAYLIENSVVMIDANTSEQFTPHAIGLTQCGGVDFAKGCYTGQEIIARMHHLGKPKDGLYRASCQAESLPPTNTEIINSEGTTVGRLLAAVANDSGQFHLLVNLRHQAAQQQLMFKDDNVHILSLQICHDMT